MSKTRRRGQTAGYSRCPKCGTPNPNLAYLTHCVSCGASRASFVEMAAEPRTSALNGVEPAARGKKLLLRLTIVYALVVVWVLTLIQWFGAIWWPAALLMLGPRWVWLLPWVPLAVVWFWKGRRRAVGIVLAVGLVITLWPLMGFHLPVSPPWPISVPGGTTLRVLSLNRGGRPIDAARLIRYIDRQLIDVLCFQEMGRDPVLDAFLAKGWHVEKDGYLASRFPIVEEIPPPPEQNETQERYTMSVRRLKVRHPGGVEFVVASVHMPTMSRGLNGGLGVGFRPERFSAHLSWWSKEFGRLVDTLSTRQEVPLLVAGDLNMPADHSLLRAIRRIGVFQFAFEERGLGYGYTMPSSLPWARIDHVLASPEWVVTRCWVGPGFGSDHLSVVAEVALPSDYVAPKQ